MPVAQDLQLLAALINSTTSKAKEDDSIPRRVIKKPPLLPVLDPSHVRKEPTNSILRFNLAEVTSIVVNSKRLKKGTILPLL